MCSNDLPRCTPEEAGMSSRQMIECIEALDHDPTTIHGFMGMARFLPSAAFYI